jgi:DNA ligase 1
MKFSALAVFFDKIEQTSSRLEMTQLLSDLFKKLDENDIDKVLYLLQGSLAPEYVKIDFGLGEKMMIKASVRALNVDRKLFMTEYKRGGDVGKAVEHFKQEVLTIGQRDMTIKEVFDKLYTLASASGEGSQDVKLSILAELIQTLDPLSTRFVSRIPTNTLRLGFSDMTILDAFSWMISGDKSLRKQIEDAYLVKPDLGFIGKVLKKKGIEGD